MTILDLFAHIGLKADTGPANDFLKTVGGIKGQLVGAIAGTLSLAAAVRTVNEELTAANEMQKFAADTGASVEEMQKWKAVADQVSGSGDAVASSIRAITENQSKIRLGQGNISGYQLLGISPTSDPFKVLEAIRNKTQGLSQSMRRNIAGQFGISKDLVATLELSNQQFEEMARNAFVIPQANVDSMNRARSSLAAVQNAANWFKAELVTALAPAITDISKKITEWVRQNKDGLIKGIQTAFEWIQRTVTMIVRVATVINNVITSTIGWKNALIGIAAIFVAMNAAVALPIAGIILFMAILEDLYVYSTGKGRSVFGLLVDKFPVLGKAFDSAFGVFKDIADAIKAIFNQDFGKLDEITKKWGLLGDAISIVAYSLKFIKEQLDPKAIAKDFGDFGKDVSEMGFWGAMGKQGKLFGAELSGMFGDVTDWATNRRPVGSSSATTVNNSPTVIVNGATDPKETGAEVERRLQREYNKAYNQGMGGKREK